MSELITCSICQEDTEDFVTTDCSHQFHATCLRRWTDRHRNCPMCRRRCTIFNSVKCAYDGCKCDNIGRYYSYGRINNQDVVYIKNKTYCEEHLYNVITFGKYRTTHTVYKIDYHGKTHYFFGKAFGTGKITETSVRNLIYTVNERVIPFRENDEYFNRHKMYNRAVLLYTKKEHEKQMIENEKVAQLLRDNV